MLLSKVFAFILFNKFLTNPHMRILSISTDEYKDFGMILLMRNGNVLIAQGIELSKKIPKEISSRKIYESANEAVSYIMDQINNTDDEIVASVIGLSNSNTIPYNNNVLPFIINPILDDNHQFYNGIQNYQGLLALKEGKSLKDIRLFEPNKFYFDNNIIYKRDQNTPKDSTTYREIEKILISLRFARFKNTSKSEVMNQYANLIEKKEYYTICTLDWFIMVFEDGSIDKFINSDNPEKIEEYNLELKKINKDKVLIKKNIEAIHDYGTVELDDSYEKHIKILKKHL